MARSHAGGERGGKAYQVNVMVGNSASAERVDEAIAVGRSSRLTH
jgi:hypothetical protein